MKESLDKLVEMKDSGQGLFASFTDPEALSQDTEGLVARPRQEKKRLATECGCATRTKSKTLTASRSLMNAAPNS